jgi:hypothetical protein
MISLRLLAFEFSGCTIPDTTWYGGSILVRHKYQPTSPNSLLVFAIFSTHLPPYIYVRISLVKSFSVLKVKSPWNSWVGSFSWAILAACPFNWANKIALPIILMALISKLSSRLYLVMPAANFRVRITWYLPFPFPITLSWEIFFVWGWSLLQLYFSWTNSDFIELSALLLGPGSDGLTQIPVKEENSTHWSTLLEFLQPKIIKKILIPLNTVFMLN